MTSRRASSVTSTTINWCYGNSTVAMETQLCSLTNSVARIALEGYIGMNLPIVINYATYLHGSLGLRDGAER